jgi:CRP-like cAMP-binding protein
MQFELLPPVPAVVVARELRQIPMFRSVSVDALFRFSTIARQARHKQGGSIQSEGARAEYFQVLVEGRALLSGPHRKEEEATPPTLLGFREVLEGTAYQETATAVDTSICLVLEAGEFRSLLSENIEMAQGLFRMLLEMPSDDAPPSISRRAVEKGIATLPPVGQVMRPIDKALLLQELPVFSKTGGEETLELSAVAQEVVLEKNASLFTEGDSASIWIILSGDVALESPAESATDPIAVTAGDVVSIEETLGGRSMSWRGRVVREGRALKVERDPLFEVLADRMDLLQGLFRSLFQTRQGSPPDISPREASPLPKSGGRRQNSL